MQDQAVSLQEKGIKATFLGSTQKDPSVTGQLAQGTMDVVFVTVERFFAGGRVDPLFIKMASDGKIGLIAVDEAHLIISWKSFRPDYTRLSQLSSLFPNLPLMALTATAPPGVLEQIVHVIPDPVISQGSVNQPNVSYRVFERQNDGRGKEQKLNSLVDQLMTLICAKKAIIYLDFAKDIDPLAIALRQAGVQSCTYKGQRMSGHDKTHVIDNWRKGDIKVMVCTSAFGMGINQPDVDIVIHIGVPSSIESMIQEFGRAGRDGRNAEGVVLFSESDLHHADYWCKSNGAEDVLPQFQKSWRYVYSHLIGECRRKVIMDYFDEDPAVSSVSYSCCDVCTNPPKDIEDQQKEMVALLSVVKEIPGNGEVKLMEWLRGSSSKTSTKLRQNAVSDSTFGSGRHLELSAEAWRLLIRQAWLTGFLNRDMKQGVGKMMTSGVIFNVYSLSLAGMEFLDNPKELMLPTMDIKSPIRMSQKDKEPKPPKSTRKGAGSQALPVIKGLMCTSTKWFTISTSNDYHFPGVFQSPSPARMGYCPDLTQLTGYEESDPDFLFSDIQLGKGKARNVREVALNVDGKEEKVLYRIVPCGGVKLCPLYGDQCNYVVSTRECRRCPAHATEDLVRSSPCPVEFVYIRPAENSDCRRWLTGIVRSNELTSQNLHNHPIHRELKITAKIDADIRRAIVDNPQLKTQDIITGKGMSYIPGAASLAATHRGKVKNIRLSTLRDASQNVDHRACILDFEKEAIAFDNTQKRQSSNGGEHLIEYASLGHPYIRDYSLTATLNWVLLMNPLMIDMLSQTDFIEVDVTYRASVELEYLLNAVTFNYNTMRWMTVARVYLDRLTADAYCKCFEAIFSAASSATPKFAVGTSLVGIITDWSDHQFAGLEKAVGKDIAESVVKGCQVHFKRSVKRVAHTVCKGDIQAYNAFKAIGYHTLKATLVDDIKTLFSVLCGDLSIQEAVKLIPTSEVLHTYATRHNPSSWQGSASWSEWWTRPRHLKMLSSAACAMNPSTFSSLPSTTNAVESLHRVAKGKYPDVLKVALMSVYKNDMASALEHLAACKNIPTSFERLTPTVRAQKAKTAQKARVKRMRDNDDNDGPPDKHSDFRKCKSKLRINAKRTRDNDDPDELPQKRFDRRNRNKTSSTSVTDDPSSTSKLPASSTSKSTHSSTSRSTDSSTSKSTDSSTSKPPASSTSKSMDSSTSKSTDSSTSKPPANSTSKPSHSSTSKPPASSTSKSMDSSTSKSTDSSTSKPPASSMSKSMDSSTSKSMDSSTSKSTDSSTSKPLASSTSKPPASSTSKSTDSSTSKPLTSSTSKSTDSSTSKSTDSSTSKSTDSSTSKSTDSFTSKSMDSSTSKPLASSTSKPSTRSTSRASHSSMSKSLSISSSKPSTRSTSKSSGDPSSTANPSDSSSSKPSTRSSSKPLTRSTSKPSGDPSSTSKPSVKAQSPCSCRSRCHRSKSCACKESGRLCSQACHPGHTCTNVDTVPVDTVDLTDHDQDLIAEVSDQVWVMCHGIKLGAHHKEVLQSRQWLDDKIINVAQALLKAQHPLVGGFQDIALAQKLAMTPEPGEFIQLLNVGSQHWITVSNIGCTTPFSVKVYDSMHWRLTGHEKKVVADLLQCREKAIMVSYMDVQLQAGGSDCGLFALAFATSLCNGDKPEAVLYEQSSLRNHLFSGIMQQKLLPFPKKRKRKPRQPIDQRIPVFCVCRLIDDGRKMIQCAHCREWFHVSCVQVETKYIENVDLDWNCNACQKNL